jgi:hypothetical protein
MYPLVAEAIADGLFLPNRASMLCAIALTSSSARKNAGASSNDETDSGRVDSSSGNRPSESQLV